MQRDDLSDRLAAGAAMIPVDDGKLTLDELVDRLLPEPADRRVLRDLDGPIEDTVPVVRPISVDELLTLRMGTGKSWFRANTLLIRRSNRASRSTGGSGDAPTLDAWIAALGRLPLMRQPGEAWLYDTELTVLGVLIAPALGQKQEDFMCEPVRPAKHAGHRTKACRRTSWAV